MFVLDTNVLSETVKPFPDATVMAWFRQQPDSLMFTTAITQAEMSYGVWLLPEGKRRQALAEAIDAMFQEDFCDRVLPFDGDCAAHYAEIMASRKAAQGRSIPEVDAQIAAIAKRFQATVVTRNTKHFEHCGVSLINPWQADVKATTAPVHTASS